MKKYFISGDFTSEIVATAPTWLTLAQRPASGISITRSNEISCEFRMWRPGNMLRRTQYHRRSRDKVERYRRCKPYQTKIVRYQIDLIVK